MTGAERAPGVLPELEARAAELVPVVAGRLAQVRSRIAAAGGDPAKIRIVAVTKTFGPEVAVAALRNGLLDIGENYADELVAKAEALRGLPEGHRAAGVAPGANVVSWHFIGAIQRRKVARLAPYVTWWETVARVEEAEAILSRAPEPAPRALVEVNISGDPGRPGCAPADLAPLVSKVRHIGLDLRGLMAVAPLGADGPAVEGAFRDLAARGRDLGLPELSIGMSGDLEQAVRAGSTMVRVGSALFGPRNPHAPR